MDIGIPKWIKDEEVGKVSLSRLVQTIINNEIYVATKDVMYIEQVKKWLPKLYEELNRRESKYIGEKY